MSTIWVYKELGLPHNPNYRRQRAYERRHPDFSIERSTVYDFEQVQEAISSAAWRQSKGYVRPDHQFVGRHQYLVRQQQPEQYKAIRWWIEHEAETYKADYGGYTYTYWNHDGWRYWTMGPIILNRAELEDVRSDPLAEALQS